MKIGIIIVCFDDKVDSSKLLKQILVQKNKEDIIYLVDNNPSQRNFNKYKKIRDIEFINLDNVGFGAACNLAANKIKNKVDAYLFLNPDTTLSENCLKKFHKLSRDYQAYMGLLLTKEGLINNDGTSVHVTGMSWCGNLDKKSNYSKGVSSINYASAASLFIWKDTFYEVGGFNDLYFLYYEDTDLSSKLILSGYKVGLLADAIVYHDYTYSISKIKYYYLQRNRIIYQLINWPWILLVLLLPVNLTIELSLFVHSIFYRRFKLKIKSYIDIFKKYRKIYEARQHTKTITNINPLQVYQTLDVHIDSPLMKSGIILKILDFIIYNYSFFVRFILNIIY